MVLTVPLTKVLTTFGFAAKKCDGQTDRQNVQQSLILRKIGQFSGVGRRVTAHHFSLAITHTHTHTPCHMSLIGSIYRILKISTLHQFLFFLFLFYFCTFTSAAVHCFVCMHASSGAVTVPPAVRATRLIGHLRGSSTDLHALFSAVEL